MTYTSEIQHSIFIENLPMYGGMVLVFLAGFLIILDVYKRQVHNCQFIHRHQIFATMSSDELKKPVSYTHLDVYKRQA